MVAVSLPTCSGVKAMWTVQLPAATTCPAQSSVWEKSDGEMLISVMGMAEAEVLVRTTSLVRVWLMTQAPKSTARGAICTRDPISPVAKRVAEGPPETANVAVRSPLAVGVNFTPTTQLSMRWKARSAGAAAHGKFSGSLNGNGRGGRIAMLPVLASVITRGMAIPPTLVGVRTLRSWWKAKFAANLGKP